MRDNNFHTKNGHPVVVVYADEARTIGLVQFLESDTLGEVRYDVVGIWWPNGSLRRLVSALNSRQAHAEQKPEDWALLPGKIELHPT